MSASPPHPLPTVESFVEVLPVPPMQELRRGVVRFVGLTDFADGDWVGVELVGSEGRNDGSVKGQSYFKCLPGQGVFVRPNLVVPYRASRREEKDTVPDPSLVTIAALEEQLVEAQQQLAERAEANAALSAELTRARAQLATVQAAAEAQRAADDEDDFAAQVHLEEERLGLQKELEACQLELRRAEASARTAENARTDAEARVKEARVAQQHSEDKGAQLQERLTDLQKELATSQAETTAARETAAAAASQARAATQAASVKTPQSANDVPAPQVTAAMPKEMEALRGEFERAATELHQLRQQQKAQDEEIAAANSRASAAERRLEEVEHERRADTAAAHSAHAAAVALLHAQLASLRAEAAEHADAKAVDVRAVEERLAVENKAALRAQEAASQNALATLHHEKHELQELCLLLEDELKEEKNQSDELARLVEQLGLEKGAAEAAVDTVQQQTIQERDRLRRELEEARAREVHLMAAVEEAQNGRDAAVRQQQQQQAAETSITASREVSLAPNTHNTNTQESLEAALQECRNELDEAQVRILQLTSTEHVAQELQQRCDALSRAMQGQRQEMQRRLVEVQAHAETAQTKAAEEVTLWKRQCVAAQRSALELSGTVAQLQQQLAMGSTGGALASPQGGVWGSALDGAQERRYEERIAALTRQLLGNHAGRLSAVSAWSTHASREARSVSADDGSFNTSLPLVRVLDFSSREACKASTQSLFR